MAKRTTKKKTAKKSAKKSVEEKQNFLKETFTAINKKFGADTLRLSGNKNLRKMLLNVPAWDYASDGGVIINRINETYGPFSSLKSYFWYLTIAEFQHYDWANDTQRAFSSFTCKQRKSPSEPPEILSYRTRRGYKPKNEPKFKYAVLVDIEGTYDAKWGEQLGVDNDCLIYYSPSSLEECVDVMDAFLRNPEISLIVLDSMHIVGSDTEMEDSMEKKQMAINAFFWNKATRKFVSAMNANPDNDITLCVVNGSYSKVGIAFGDPEVVKNGEQMKLAKSLSIKTEAYKQHKAVINDVEVVAGRNIKLSNKKNKAGQPLRSVSFYFSFVDDGTLSVGETDIISQLVELGTRFGLVERRGNGYAYGDVKGRGMETFKTALQKDDAWKELKSDLYDVMITK